MTFGLLSAGEQVSTSGRVERRQSRLLIRLLAAMGLVAASAGLELVSQVPANAADSGASITVAENFNTFGVWPTLDPPVDTASTGDAQYFDAIYGNLFSQAPNGDIVPDLAKGYSFEKAGLVFSIHLRPGVTFSDGTPFNASAVAFSIRRDLDPKGTCQCLASFSAVKSVTTPNSLTVDLNLKTVDAHIKYAFFQFAPNWIQDPTAMKKMGEKAYGLKPVGAGPFEVANDSPDNKLVLQKNPHYWQKGLPFLNQLTFLSVGNDQSAYSALVTGQAQAYQGYSNISALNSVAKHVRVTPVKTLEGAKMVILNTAHPPFNNLKARAALYYATDPAPINKALYGGRGVPAESPTIPGGLYYEATVPGYRTYNLAKAKALVKQLGGLKFQILGSQEQTQQETMEALVSQWNAAGMGATLTAPLSTPQLVKDLSDGNWQASLEGAGGYDPAIGTDLTFFYQSNATFSGIHDQKLDRMISEGGGSLQMSKQESIYKGLWKYISDEAYTPFLFTLPSFDLSTHSVSIPGLSTTGYEIMWQNAKVTGDE